jgi:hypothetical protein
MLRKSIFVLPRPIVSSLTVPEVIDDAAALLLEMGGATETIRVYYGTHGQDEMH